MHNILANFEGGARARFWAVLGHGIKNEYVESAVLMEKKTCEKLARCEQGSSRGTRPAATSVFCFF